MHIGLHAYVCLYIYNYNNIYIMAILRSNNMLNKMYAKWCDWRAKDFWPDRVEEVQPAVADAVPRNSSAKRPQLRRWTDYRYNDTAPSLLCPRVFCVYVVKLNYYDSRLCYIEHVPEVFVYSGVCVNTVGQPMVSLGVVYTGVPYDVIHSSWLIATPTRQNLVF